MATQAQATPTPSEPYPEIYSEVDKYPWDTDEEFQGGLAAILGSDPSPARTAELTLRARCFYYSRYADSHLHKFLMIGDREFVARPR
jgi:hypothetical protein